MLKYVLAGFLSVFAFAALPGVAEACEKHAAAAAAGEAAGCDPANCPMAKEHGGECPMAKGGECPMAKKGEGQTCTKCGKCAAGTCDGSKCDAAKCDGTKCGKGHGHHHQKKAGSKADAKPAAQPSATTAAR